MDFELNFPPSLKWLWQGRWWEESDPDDPVRKSKITSVKCEVFEGSAVGC